MSKIIFFTDLHHGGDIIAPADQKLSLWGAAWGLPMLKAMIKYGEKTPLTTMMHGGDELTFLHANTLSEKIGIPTKKREATQQYLRNAHQTKNLMLSSRLPFARVIGNHDPIGHLDKMGFNRASHIFSKSALPHTDIIVCQPTVRFDNGRALYEYDPDHIIALIDESQNPNLIIGSHWAFDREELGISGKNGYAYTDKTSEIRSYLEAQLRDGKKHSVVSLHGHSHRFRLGQTGPIDMLTMPSIVQNDQDMPEFPCGFFVEIEENEHSGELTLAFKRIRLVDETGDKYVVQDVSQEAIAQYQRGRKPAGSKMTY